MKTEEISKLIEEIQETRTENGENIPVVITGNAEIKEVLRAVVAGLEKAEKIRKLDHAWMKLTQDRLHDIEAYIDGEET